MKTIRRKCFCENICQLLGGGDVYYIDGPTSLMLTNKVIDYVNMLLAPMKLWIVDKADGTLVVQQKASRDDLSKTKISKTTTNPNDVFGS